MKSISKKLLSLLLTVAIVLQLLPASVFATGENEETRTLEELLLADAGSLAVAEESTVDILFEEVALREENIKHFRMTDGSYKAVIYDTPVHYLDENGIWQEYDNTLHTVSRSGNAAYCVENGDSLRFFAASTSSEALLSVQKGDYSLKLTPLSSSNPGQAAHMIATEAVGAEVLTIAAPGEEPLVDSIYSQAQPQKIYSALEYEDIFAGASLRYENYANSIKESIVITAPQEEYTYAFLMQVVGLTPTLQTDGSIFLADEDGTVIYTIPAPYMIDANNEVSYAASYTMAEKSGTWILTVTADSAWMNAEGRAFPVLLDPTITETAASDDDICATYVRSGYPDAATGTETGLYAGNNGNSNQKTRTYVHINELPVLPAGCELTGAAFGLYQYAYEGSGSLDIGLYALTSAAYNGTAINGLTSTATWKSWADGLTWNMANSTSAVHSSIIVDRLTTSSANSGDYVAWDITKLAFQWYDSDNDGAGSCLANYGFMLKPTDEDSATSRATFYGPKKTTNRPRIVISYHNVRGIEPDYTYQTASIGRAGTAYIGDFAMQNTLIVPLASAPSDVMPFSVSLVYNSSMRGRYFSSSYESINSKNFDTMKTGIGWKLSLQETVVPLTVGDTTYLVYTDSDGTEHYYTYSSEENAYVEEDSNARLKITQSGSEYILADEYGGTKTFFNGYLTEIKDAYNNALYYCYDGVDYSAESTAWKPTASGAHKITSVWRKNNGVSAEKILVLGYNGEFLSTIIPKCDYSSEDSKADHRIYLTYETRTSGSYLSQIQFADGAKAQYQYIAADAKYWRMNKLSSAYDAESNYGVSFDYSYSGKSEDLYEYVLLDTAAANTESNREYGVKIHGYKRAHSLAVWRDYGRDQTEGTPDDYLTYKILNPIGQTVCAYTTDNEEKTQILGSSAAEYTSSTNRKQNNLLSASAYTAQPGVNLLRNGDAEDNGSYWSAVNYSFAAHYNGAKSFVLNNNSFYQLATLSAGKTYTFSAYVNMETEADESVIQLAIMDASGEILSASPALTTSTQGVNDGWQRLSATYHNSGSSDITVMASVLSSGLSGNAYVDCLQLEAETAASTYNLVENGSFEQDATISTSVPSVGWYYAGNAAATTAGVPLFGDKALQINGGSGLQRISQQVLLNAPAGSTFLLSGWGKADALPGSVREKTETDQPYYGLIARLYYADDTSDVFYFPLNQYSSSWQQVNGILAPKEGNENKAITEVSIVAAYDNNVNTAYFDNISFRREPAQTYRYDENGNPIAATQTGTGTEGAEYAENGVDLLNYTAANGTKYNYEYNSAHDVTSASAAGITARTEYNDAGNVTGSTLSGTGTTLTMVSAATATDDLNHTESVTDTNGNTTTYTYDDYSGLLTEVKNAKNSVTHYSYAVGNLRTESVQQDNLVRINYGYENGNLTSLTRGDYDEESGNIDAATAQTYNFSYNRWGQVTETKVGSQTLSANTYYAFNGEVEGVGGYLSSTTYGNGDEITYTYDELDRLVEKAYTNGTYIRYAYNSEGQLAELIHGETGEENPIAHFFFEYDSLGRLIRSAEYDGESTLVQRTEHIYDAYNRLSSQSWGFGTTTYGESYTYSDGENGDGSITQMTTATGDAIGYTYDKLKRLEKTTTTNADGATLFTTAYDYIDLSGTRTTSQIEYRNVRIGENGTILEGKKYSYDALGNITEISQSTSPFNILAKFEYDEQNQLVSEIYYNGNGSGNENITSAYYYTYDTAGNLQKVETGTVNSDNEIVTTEVQSYDYSDGDWKDLLQSFTRNGTTYSITYEGSGNPLSYGNWSFSWQNGRQLSSATSSTDTTDTILSYTYDADGIRTSKTYTVDVYEDIPQYTVTFVADGTTVKTMTVLDGYVLQNSDYPTIPEKEGYVGAWNKYTSAIHGNITITASYRTLKTHTVTFIANSQVVKVMTVYHSYVLQDSDYPAVPPRTGLTGSWNKYTSPINSNITITAVYRKGSASVASLAETESSSDIVLDGSDAEVLSSEVATAEVETASLPEREGQRLVSTQTVSHEYLTISGRVAREIIKTDGTVTAVMDFIYDANGQPFALNYFEGTATEPTTYYYILNLQGDVVKLVTANGTSVAEYTYNAWGEITASSGTMANLNPLRYRGYYYDTETGFYYLQSRYYDPVTHRFINADVYTTTDVADAISSNMFAYCGNSPVMGYDPTGRINWEGFITGLVIVAAAVITVATYGAASPLAAAVVCATVATGTVMAATAVTEEEMVIDVSVTVPIVPMVDYKVGGSMIMDFGTDETHFYTHKGLTATTSPAGASYSVGSVENFSGPESYAGEFYDFNAAEDVGIDHCWAPNNSISATCITFSRGYSFGVGWDYYYLIATVK